MRHTVEQDFSPPSQASLWRWLLVAAVIHVPLLVALTLGIDWKRSGSVRGDPEPELAPARQAQVLGAGVTPSAPGTAPCPIRPLLEAGGNGDGQLFPPADVVGKKEADIAAFLVVGKEAAAAGQRRNAEVAFLTACRVANALKGEASLASADARYQLGRLYASTVSEAGSQPLPERSDALKKAEALYLDSLRSYQAHLGEPHEKTRFAAQGLAAVQAMMAPPAPAPAAAAPAKPVPYASPRAQAAVAASGKGPLPPGRVRPSFDCANARSVPERLICSDAELARLDRELGRLHTRAREAAADTTSFKRQGDEEWRRREATCRDRECLRRWYAQRRAQLLVTVSEAFPQEDSEPPR